MTPRVPTPEELRTAANAALAAGNDRPTVWETAFHEAGHVVVEVATGSYPDSVYLNDDNHADSDHAGRTSGRSFLGAERLRGDRDERAAAWAEAECRRYAAVLAAGDVAADIARGYQPEVDDVVSLLLEDEAVEGTDAEKLRALVDGVAPGHAEIWLEEAFREAERLLRERWRDVERVATALVERRHLSRDALFDLLPVDVVPITNGTPVARQVAGD